MLHRLAGAFLPKASGPKILPRYRVPHPRSKTEETLNGRRNRTSQRGSRRNRSRAEDQPWLQALAYFALGDDPVGDAEASLGHYYAWLGEEIAGMIVGAAAKDADGVRQYLAAYEEAGCDELIFFPSSSDPAQVDLLADALGR